ncbi:MAG: ABC-F family ATP-binding cassette domain-containing protein [Clostridiaceae bacterium]|nr:ABC-F family ATP-binding cassette domain-containing protein [Clostridiaceae bacterium]
MLVIKDLSIYLSKDLRVLLEDFNFSLQPGQKVAVIGEEGNGKSTLLKAIAEPESLRGYAEVRGEIISDQEIIGYLPQVLTPERLMTDTETFLNKRVNWDHFDYTEFYGTLAELGFPAERISSEVRLRDLSGGEKIKFQLLCELARRPTLLLLDEPGNDLDLESLVWLENFIINQKLPIIFVSHDETLLNRCSNTIIHIEQLRRKSLPQYTIAGVGYADYVERREAMIIRQTRLANKEKAEFEAKMERYRRVYERVQHELRSVSRQDPQTARNLKDKMHSVKSMGRRFAREKENMTERPDVEAGIMADFGDIEPLPNNRPILRLQLKRLEVGDLLLSRDLQLDVTGPEKVALIGANGSGKTTLLRLIRRELTENGIRHAYMPQEYSERLDPEQNAIDFLTLPERRGRKDALTRVRTYLGSLKFTEEEMFHPVLELSGGQRAKLYFAKLLLDRPQVMLLDEPTRNLSPLSAPEIRAALHTYAGCIICVTHDRMLLRTIFDRVLRLTESGLADVTSDWKTETEI